MSTINSKYTFNYSQPDEYRLSHDSVFFSQKVFELTKNLDLSNARMLDVCAGSGIIGMDFLFHRRAAGLILPNVCDFIEVQEVYSSHFEENCRRLGDVSTQLNFINSNYIVLKQKNYTASYDLIIGNPPYFFPDRGKLSPSNFKNRCRFFVDAGFDDLIKGLEFSLKPVGKAYLLIREQSSHGEKIMNNLKQICKEELSISIVDEVRGTYLVEFIKSGCK